MADIFDGFLMIGIMWHNNSFSQSIKCATHENCAYLHFPMKVITKINIIITIQNIISCEASLNIYFRSVNDSFRFIQKLSHLKFLAYKI